MYLYTITLYHIKNNNKENREYTIIEVEEARMARDRERKKRKIAEETSEERECRLGRDRERKWRRRSEETNEEREARLARDRERKRKTNEETNEEREGRLIIEEEARRANVRNKYLLRKARETPQQIAARL